MNDSNLIPLNKRTKEEQREITSKGGKKSGKVRKEKKLLKEILEEALAVKTETGNKYIDITTALIKQAEKGNVRAYKIIRETLGQNNVSVIDGEDFNVNIRVIGSNSNIKNC